MQHDNKWLKDNNPFHAESGVNSSDDFDDLAREYHEHMNQWLDIKSDGLPQSDCWVVIIPKDTFCGTDNPVLAAYDKERKMFSENGEEFPHAATVRYKTVHVEGQ